MSTCSISYRYIYIWNECCRCCHLIPWCTLCICNWSWLPNETPNTLYQGDRKLFSGFKSTLLEPLEHFYSVHLSRNNSSCATTTKNNLDYLELKVIKLLRENRRTYALTITIFRHTGKHVRKIMTEPYIDQKMGHASHEKIQKVSYLGIIMGPPESIPKLKFAFPICTISKVTCLIWHPTVIT